MNPQRPRLAGSPFAATARFFAQCGGVEAVAAFAGKSPSTVYKWSDPDQSDGPPIAVVALLTDHFRAPALAEHLALRAGGVFLPLPDAAKDGGRFAELTAETAEHAGTLLAKSMRALSPTGEGGAAVTPREARSILGDVDELMTLLAQMRAQAQTVAEGGS